MSQLRDIRSGVGETERPDSIPEGLLPLDTVVPMQYVVQNDYNTTHILHDQFTWRDIVHSPLTFDQIHLGNLGSPVRSASFPISNSLGFSTGIDMFDPYYLKDETFRYYTQSIPAVTATYSQHSNKDTYLTLDFGRRFANGVSFSLIYKRIHQTGEFAHQRQRNTALGFGVWQDAPSGKYDAFYTLISNSAVGEENGGIVTDSLIGLENRPDLSIPIVINAGASAHKERFFATKQIFHLLADSTSFGIDIWLKASYLTEQYKYVDTEANDIPDYYTQAFLTDARGIRNFFRQNTYEGQVGIRLPWKSAHSILDSWIRYRKIDIQQEPEQRNRTELYLESTGDFQWISALQLKGQLSIGLGSASGNYRLHADGTLDLASLGKLKGGWSVISRSPSLMETRLFINQIKVYENDFSNPFHTTFHVMWENEKHAFSAGITWTVLDNYIYFDASYQPLQLTSGFSLRQFAAYKEFDLGWFGARAGLRWQPDPKTELALPETMFEAGINGRIGLFQKKVILLPDLNVTYFDTYAGLGYFPVNGIFYLTNAASIPSYLRVDAGVAMKINFLTIFVQMQDIEGLFQDRVLYQADLYPHFRGYLRVGCKAGFFN